MPAFWMALILLASFYNGDAIYGTRPWEICGTSKAKIADGWHTERKNEPLSTSDLRFTTKGVNLCVIMPEWPDKSVTIVLFKRGSSVIDDTIQQISLLGTDFVLNWHQDTQGFTVQLPEQPTGKHAFVLKLSR
jgi:alpha-L-fucosidase